MVFFGLCIMLPNNFVILDDSFVLVGVCFYGSVVVPNGFLKP